MPTTERRVAHHPRASRRRRTTARADVPDNLVRGVVLGAIIVAAIWLLFGTGPA